MALSTDSHLEVIPLLFEQPHSYHISYDLERFDNGTVSGDLDQPEDRERECFKFEGISNRLPAHPQDSLRTTLDYFQSGGQVRVYRMYPANLTAWDATSNETGYSDMVPEDAASAEYPWFGPTLTVYSFTLEGVAVR